jgi:hypothetical protein
MATSCRYLLRLNTTREEGDDNKLPSLFSSTHCHYLLLFCNTTIEKNDNTLSSSSSSQTWRRQNTQENNKKKTKRKEGVYLQVLGLPFHFWLSLLPFYFKRFLMTSSSQAIEKKTQRTRKEKKL